MNELHAALLVQVNAMHANLQDKQELRDVVVRNKLEDLARCIKHPIFLNPVPHRARYYEQRIALALAETLLAAGYTISVNDGDTEEDVLKNSTDINAVLDAMWSTDEDWWIVRKPGSKTATVRWIYGNSGWDVINDYGISLEPYMASLEAMQDEFEAEDRANGE